MKNGAVNAGIVLQASASSLRVRKKGSFRKGVFSEKSISRDSREFARF